MVAATSRVRNVSVTRPIIYGNTTVPLEPRDRRKDTPENHTHRWTVFIRDPTGKDDLSYIVRKVVFKLHDTYAQPMRTVEQPPWEVTETGWGEFEVTMKVFFVLPASEKNIVLYHHLKLHPFGPDVGDHPRPRPVESIQYDELVFNEPTEAMFDILTSRPGAVLLARPDPPLLPFSYENEAQELAKLKKGADAVTKEIDRVHQRLKKLEAERATLAPSQ